MAFPDDFIPELWSAAVLDNLDKNLILANLVNRDYENLVQNQGDIVHAQKFTTPAAGTYSGTVTYAAEASSTVALNLNQDRYAAVSIDDVDQVQANVDLLQGYAGRIAYSLADQIDQYIGTLYTGSSLTVISWDVGTTDPWDGVVTQAAENLNAQNVPQAGRWMVVRPKGLSALVRSADFIRASDMGDEVIRTGAIGMAGGFMVFMSNNLANTTGNFYKYLYGHSMGISLAVQHNPTVEAVRRDAAFETGLRARVRFGAAAVQPTAFGDITADET